MPSPSVSTTWPTPVRMELAREIDRAVAAVQDGQGQATVTATRRGVEASLAYKPASWLSVGGYAARLWGGGWEAGARAVAVWGRR
jgi:hypothetical protein